MLFIFGGLPGTGKTELSAHLARKVGAAYVRIDSIEQAMRAGGITTMGPNGYFVAYRVAGDNLRLGLPVVADSVNPVNSTRQAWREVATRAGVAFSEIEVICSDEVEHRRRVETRASRITGMKLPSWEDVIEREYHSWLTDHIVIDTAGQTSDKSKADLEKMLELL